MSSPISSCSSNKESLVFIEGTENEAIARFQESFPEADQSALCHEGDQFFLDTAKFDVIDYLGETDKVRIDQSFQDDRQEFIFDLLHKQLTANLFRANLEEERVKLAEALKTRAHLKEAGVLHRSPVEEIILYSLSVAFGFGIVTEVFKDSASLLAFYTSYFGKLVYAFQKEEAIRSLMLQMNLCGSRLTVRDGTLPVWGDLLSKVSPLIAGGLGTWGFIQFAENTSSADEDFPIDSPSLHLSQDRSDKILDVTQLEQMSEEEVKTLKTQVSLEMDEILREQEKIQKEMEEVTSEIFLLYMGELRERDLEKIEDPQLKIMADELLQKGLALPDESFLENTGVTEAIGIGVGFGIATGAFHQFYRTLSPWGTWIEKNMREIKRTAWRDAEGEVTRRVKQGILKSCGEAQEKLPAEIPENNIGFVPEIDSAEKTREILDWAFDFEQKVGLAEREFWEVKGIDVAEAAGLKALLDQLKTDALKGEWRAARVMMNDLEASFQKGDNQLADYETNRAIAYGTGTAALLLALVASRGQVVKPALPLAGRTILPRLFQPALSQAFRWAPASVVLSPLFNSAHAAKPASLWEGKNRDHFVVFLSSINLSADYTKLEPEQLLPAIMAALRLSQNPDHRWLLTELVALKWALDKNPQFFPEPERISLELLTSRISPASFGRKKSFGQVLEDFLVHRRVDEAEMNKVKEDLKALDSFIGLSRHLRGEKKKGK